jgi:hypothetical protein
MSGRRLVFRHTVEGLFVRAYGEKVTPALRERFKAVGLDLKEVDPIGRTILRPSRFATGTAV